MLEDKDHKLQDAVGGEAGPEESSDGSDSKKQKKAVRKAAAGTTREETGREQGTVQEEPDAKPDNRQEQEETGTMSENAGGISPESKKGPEAPTEPSGTQDPAGEATATEKELEEEIDESNAEDAEDEENQRRHHIPMPDYHAMSMENLVGELQRLLRNEKVQAIRKHVDQIKSEFDLKFQDFLEHKKEDFISRGGNEIDFRYNSVTKRQFNEVYSEYREKRNQYYRNLDKSLKENLARRLEIIEELKGLVNVEEDINATYKNFKDLQEQWRNAGPVPRNNYNDVWRTYQHHIEIFYDFLHLNRELRDLDFKHNLEEKLKLVEQAEKLAGEPDLNKAFRELQTLHKIWKEDIGPVDQEHREAIWERFSNATKAMHQRRQDYHRELEKGLEKNLAMKEEIIAKIDALAANVADNHRGLQQQIRELEALRDAFFKAGKVPQKVNEATWAAFKSAVRAFNRNKNAYYKNLKKEQQDNLDKKRALLEIARSLKDSEDWDTATPEMKRIQHEWKQIGHVPRKHSDAIWKDFKAACNQYFDRLHASKNKAGEAESENYRHKHECLGKLKEFQLTGKREADIEAVKGFIEEWKSHGRVPHSKKGINAKFNKILDALFRKLDISHQEAELLKYGNKIQQLADTENDGDLYRERSFIKRKIADSKGEIRQLENNLQFFSDASEDSPIVREVVQKIERHKEALATWKAKLKKLNILQNNMNKTADEENTAGTGEPEEEENE